MPIGKKLICTSKMCYIIFTVINSVSYSVLDTIYDNHSNMYLNVDSIWNSKVKNGYTLYNTLKLGTKITKSCLIFY